jgi:hypothetical protein
VTKGTTENVGHSMIAVMSSSIVMRSSTSRVNILSRMSLKSFDIGKIDIKKFGVSQYAR